MEIRKETYILTGVLIAVILIWKKDKVSEVAHTVTAYIGSRGLRNNNPGNIRKSGDAWQGLSAEQPDSAFFTFESPEYGIRALVKLLKNYNAKGLNTISKIINRWAPPSENNTKAYINAVVKYTGVSADTPIAYNNPDLVKAIIKHENGTQPYDDSIIGNGIEMAG